MKVFNISVHINRKKSLNVQPFGNDIAIASDGILTK